MCSAMSHRMLKTSWTCFECSTVLPPGRAAGVLVVKEGRELFLSMRDCPECGSTLAFRTEGPMHALPASEGDGGAKPGAAPARNVPSSIAWTAPAWVPSSARKPAAR